MPRVVKDPGCDGHAPVAATAEYTLAVDLYDQIMTHQAVRRRHQHITSRIFHNAGHAHALFHVLSVYWLSTAGYNLEVNDDDLFLKNAGDVVRRFRNHPSIAVWNPRNEGFAPEYIEQKLASMIASDDGTRL